MLADTLLYLLPYTPTDFLFCTHHTVVIVYAVSALVGGRGAISYIILTLIGECTSLWQNSWYICKVFKSQSEVRVLLTQSLGICIENSSACGFLHEEVFI